MVVWTSQYQDGSEWGVYGQRYDSTGDEVGTEFRVNRATGGDQSSPAIAVQPNGTGIIVAYEGQDGSGYGVYDVRLPLPDANLPQAVERAGLEQQVNLFTTGDQYGAQVAKLSDGTYVVVWQSAGQDGSSWGVYARHFDADGDPLLWNDGNGGTVAELRINLTTSSDQSVPHIAALPDDGVAGNGLADGGFVVTWESQTGTGTGYDIMARRFAADGTDVPLKDSAGNPTTELTISQGSGGNDHNGRVAVAADGSFTVIFQSDRDGSSWSIASHHVDTTGKLAPGADNIVNQNTDGEQRDAE